MRMTAAGLALATEKEKLSGMAGGLLCLHFHDRSLRIAMGSEPERNIRKGSGNGTASEPEVDFRTMLICCAQAAVATGDHRS